MSATTTGSFPLSTESPYTGGQDGSTGDANSGSGSAADGNAAGASGTDTGGLQISHGAMVAIIVVVVVVALVGIASSVLFYLAKKREWKVRETIRKSTRKVVAALTPRRSEFPRSVKESTGGRSKGGRVRLDDVPPTPRLKPEDLEKGYGPRVTLAAIDKKKRSNFSRK
ncbi:hypothetical protein CONLIGDRAFT_75798 [Coniochaeta ligniaria NRRL 30616]|uniref:Uncharacterized protein n=1 Tax=Coniochaeta ligniaria NRRL 30616 TaxID=1408157 RepID=A0A1J7IB59_9PEZI|nr:hypothetical protein CONLIGDRAFT_75798 [Coniochaeta ligniaria NRRL 30616]